jgi:hypothetical protein
LAARNKTELYNVASKEFAKLFKLIDSFDEQTAMRKNDDDTSVKDVIAHRAHWITLYFGWYYDGQAGKAVYFPAKGYKWNDLKRYNADLRDQQSDLDWAGAVDMLRANGEELLKFITDSTNGQLYCGPMKGANNNWTTGRWAEAAGPSHFRSAGKYLRATLKQAK